MLRGVVLSPDGSRRLDAEIARPPAQAEAMGVVHGRQLSDQGADALLRSS